MLTGPGMFPRSKRTSWSFWVAFRMCQSWVAKPVLIYLERFHWNYHCLRKPSKVNKSGNYEQNWKDHQWNSGFVVFQECDFPCPSVKKGKTLVIDCMLLSFDWHSWAIGCACKWDEESRCLTCGKGRTVVVLIIIEMIFCLWRIIALTVYVYVFGHFHEDIFKFVSQHELSITISPCKQMTRVYFFASRLKSVSL